MKNLIPILFIICILSACNSRNNKNTLYELASDEANMEIKAPQIEAEESAYLFSVNEKPNSTYANSKKRPNQVEQSNTAVQRRKLIKTGSIQFEAEDISKSRNQLDLLIKKHNAFISNEQNTNESYELKQNISIRIPFKNFDSFIKELDGKVSKFDYKSISTQDVTEEYIDIESRLKAKYKLEESYLSLLKKALKIKDIVDIEKELSYVRADIESMEGRLRYLSDRVSLSTLNIIIYKNKIVEYRKEKGFFSKLWYNFQLGFDGLLSFLLGLISIWPSLVLISIVIFIIRRWWKSRKKKQ